MKKYIYITICTLALFCCRNKQKSDIPVITVTIEPLRYFAEAVAGDKFLVTTIVPKGSNPETYEPTPQQMKALAVSSLYIKVGEIGFERAWADKLQQNAPDTKFIDSSENVVISRTANGIPDPHTWMSCRNAEIIARNIFKAIAAADPDNESYYKSNFELLEEKIRQTEEEISGMAYSSKAFLIYHPSLTYFARDLGLFQLPVEEEGREPSARQIKHIIKKARSCGVKVMFVQQEFDSHNTNAIIKATGATAIEINPLSYDWHGEMRKTAKALE